MAGFDLRGGKPANYVLGRGKLYLSGDSNRLTNLNTAAPNVNTQEVWRDVGNVTAFTITQESETKEHRSSLQGLQVVDIEVPVSQKMSLSFTTDEINANNLARFLSGVYLGRDNDTALALGNGAAIASDDASITSADRNFFVDTATTDRVHDVWYVLTLDLSSVAGIGGNLPTPVRCIDFEVQDDQAVTVLRNPTSNVSVDGTPLTEGVDFEFDRKMGRIRFLSTGALVAGDTFRVEWDAPSVAKSSTPGLDDKLFVIQPLTTSGVTVGVMFVMENANDGDIPLTVEFWRVKLKPDGEFAGIGDDWAQVSFTGVVESVSEYAIYGSEYGRIIGRNSFSSI